MLQPIVFKKLTKSLISGSIAQLDNVVVPFAKLAAIIKFSVAPTEIFENLILLPFNPLGALAITYPWSILYLTPNFDNALRCISTGRVPIAHPPGKDTFADLWMQLEMGEKDGSTKQRLIDTMAEAEVDVEFDSFAFGNIYNQIGELEFDINNPEAFQLTSLSPEGETVIEFDDEDEEDYSDDEEESKTLH